MKNKINDYELDRYVIKKINNVYELKIYYKNNEFATLNFTYLNECLEVIKNGFKEYKDYIFNINDLEIIDDIKEIKKITI